MPEETAPEESKTPKAAAIKLHVINLVAGLVGGVACFGFVLVAKVVGLQLSELAQEGLILGGMASAGVSIYGAKKLPGSP